MYSLRWYWDREHKEPRLKILDAKGIHVKKLPFTPYFYVKDPSTGSMEKIECQTPSKVKEMGRMCQAEGLEVFESDVMFTRRVMMDLEWKISDPEKFLVYDIETEDADEFPDPKIAKYRILSICAKGSDGKVFQFCDDDEKKIIKQFLKVAYDYKITAGWNSSRFDDQYIKNRCEMWLDIPYDDFAMVPIDLLPLYRFVTLVEKTSFSLDNIAKIEGIGEKIKVEVVPGEGRISNLFHHDRKKLLEYNMNDVDLTFAIEAKYSLINILFSLCQNCYTQPSDHFYIDEVTGMPQASAFQGVETILIKKANDLGVRIPTRTEKTPPTYLGGMVLKPPRLGIVENVVVLDYKSLYPKIMSSFNMGPDTFIADKSGPIKAPLGSFRNDKTSYIAATIKELMHMKNEIGELKAKVPKGSFEHKALFWRYHSTKVVINSLFGATGFFRSRHYKFEVCQNVQSVEREILPETIAIVQRMGYEVVLADTDSVGFVIGSLQEAEEVCAKVNVEINRWIHEKFNTIESEKYELELDKYYSSLMLIAKKKYAGIVVYESGDCMYVYKRGLESVRSDWCQAVREFQDKLLFKLLTKKDWKGYIKATKTKFFEGLLDEQMIVSKTLKKPIDQYETATPHVRAASMLAEMGHPVRIGDKVWYIKVGDDKESVIPVIPGQPIILKKYQREFLWKKQFESIIERFSIAKNKTLSDFF